MVIIIIFIVLAEIMGLLDIILSEYAIKKQIGEEGNPLMKKRVIRLGIGLPFSIIFPLFLLIFSTILFLTMIITYTLARGIININNVYIMIKKEVRE